MNKEGALRPPPPSQPPPDPDLPVGSEPRQFGPASPLLKTDSLTPRGPTMTHHDTERRTTRLKGLLIPLILLLGCSAGTTPTAASANPRAVRVVVIGDSIGYGQADCGGCTAFVDLYARSLGTRLGSRVTAENVTTHDGLTTAGLVDRIRTDPRYRAVVTSADILIVSIAHNDTPWSADSDPCGGPPIGDSPNWANYHQPCMSKVARAQARQLAEFLSIAKKLRSGHPTVRVVTTVYNDWIGSTGVPETATRPMARIPPEPYLVRTTLTRPQQATASSPDCSPRSTPVSSTRVDHA